MQNTLKIHCVVGASGRSLRPVALHLCPCSGGRVPSAQGPVVPSGTRAGVQGFFIPRVALGDRHHRAGRSTQQVQRWVPDSSPQARLRSSLGKAVTLPVSPSSSAPWSPQRWGREGCGRRWSPEHTPCVPAASPTGCRGDRRHSHRAVLTMLGLSGRVRIQGALSNTQGQSEWSNLGVGEGNLPRVRCRGQHAANTL